VAKSVDLDSFRLEYYKKLFFKVFFISFSGLIILIRYPSLVSSPRFWAEERVDYETFLNISNWWEGFDVLTYPAYYAGLSRLGGFLASLVTIQNAPFVTSLLSFFILLSPLAIILFTKCNYWENTKDKLILCGFFLFCCSTGETWLNTTNLGFIMPVVTFLILLDDYLKNRIKVVVYCFYLFLGILTGPISLMLFPLFLYRYINKKEREVLIYCIIFFLAGSFQVLFYVVSTYAGTGSENRMGGGQTTSLIERFIYLIQFNLIFPTLGYFLSFVFRIFMDLVNTGIENLKYLPALLEVFSPHIQAILLKVVAFFNYFKFFVFTITLAIISLFFYFLLKYSSLKEKVFFLLPYFYLSFAFSYLSLGGHGGFRYSYITSFILLFFIYLLTKKTFIPKVIRKILMFIVIFSISVSVLEYFPRMISYSPVVLSNSTQIITWPIWEDEVIKWRKNKDYAPKVWPYKKNQDFLWPEKNGVFEINLNDTEGWKNSGSKKFSKTFKEIISQDKKSPLKKTN